MEEEGATGEVLPLAAAAPGRGTGRWRPRAGPLAEPRAARGGGGGPSVRGWGRGRPWGRGGARGERARWEDEDVRGAGGGLEGGVGGVWG